MRKVGAECVRGASGEAVGSPGDIGVEPGQLARVGNAGNLRDLDTIAEPHGWIIQECVFPGICVVKESVLTRGRISVIPDSNASVVHREYLGEHEGRSRLSRYGWDRGIRYRRSGYDPFVRAGEIRHEAVVLPIGSQVEA